MPEFTRFFKQKRKQNRVLMEKKNEYIDKLLTNLQSLEAKVSLIKQEEAVSFSFFRDAFGEVQEVMNLLHELEMLHVEDMKRQMEKLVLFLSENGSQKQPEPKPVEFEETNIETVVSETPEPEEVEDAEEQVFTQETEKIVQEEKIVRRNAYAEGLVLPTYTNPRNTETKNIDTPAETPIVETAEEKPAIKSVNDIIQAPPPKLDIKRGLSLNDRFYFQRELFNNDREAMNSLMIRLNAFDNYEDTERYLREKTGWNFDDETVKSFLELLKKGFE